MNAVAARYAARRTGLGDLSNLGPSRAAQDGVKFTHAPYPNGAPGVKISLDEMARLMREARNDKDVCGYAADVLRAAGIDGRDRARWTARNVAQALLDNVRQVVMYSPDPNGTEMITSPAGQLCLRPGLCIRKEDCLPEGTLLLRDDYELVPIEQIRVGDRIWGRDKWTRVEATAFKGDLKVDAIEMNNGSTMCLTPDHKVYVGRCEHGVGCTLSRCSEAHARKVSYDRVAVSELEDGDVLLRPDRIEFGKKVFDPGVIYVDGLYLSEGWNDGHRFCISGQDGYRKEALKHEVKAICERLGVSTGWARKYIRINSRQWAQRLAPRGTRARFKNAETLDLVEESAAALLRGIMSDSTSSGKKALGRTFNTTSRTLALQTRILQRMFGVTMSCRMMTPEEHGGVGKHPLWRMGTRARSENAKKAEDSLTVRSIERSVRRAPCWDIQTEDHYVYLPEHDVTVSNCDGLSVLLGSLLMCVGFAVRICKQSWGANAQEHVLVAVQDEDGHWLKCDPSHASLPVGRGVQAHSEEYYDPMEADASVNVGTGAEIVTFGSLPTGVAAHGGHGHGGGGAQRPMHGGDGSMRRYQNGRWVSWNGMSWVPAGNIGCLQWGAPLTQPSASLRAYANSVGADNMPIISTVDGAQYLFAIKNGALVIRPCTGTVGMGAASVNDQLAPRASGVGAAVGLGITTLLDVKTQSTNTSSLMDATNAGMQSCSAMQPADLAAWNVKYAAWKAWYSDLQGCIAVSAGDETTAPPNLSCLVEFGYQWGSNVPDILRGYNTDAQNYIAKIHQACPSQSLPVVPSGPVPAPPGTPGVPSVDRWVADAEMIGKVVVGTLGVSVLAYAAYKVVQLGAGIAGKAAV